MQDKTAPQLSVCGAAECCRMTIFTGGFSMENIRIYEEDGYIHFIMRPEDLMRLRYSTEAKTPFADFMDRWLTQMKTQVRENTMDGYRYAFEKHIKPFFTARGTTLATARPMDFQDFVNLKFDQGLSPTSIVKFHSIMHKCLKYAVALQIIPTNPSDNVMLPKRTRFRGQVYDRTQINIFLAAALQSPAEAAFVLAATYGLRRSECAGLRWCAVDFRARSMVINHTAVLSSGRVIYADSVKTKSSYRTLPLSDSLRRYLTDLRRRQNANRKKYGKAYCRAITSAAVRTVRRSGRITFRVSSSGCAAARACRVSGFMIYGIRLQRFCCSRAFRSSRFRTGWGIPTSPPQPTFTRMCRMWKRYPSPRAQHRLSETDVHSGNVT